MFKLLTSNSPNESCLPWRPSWKTSFWEVRRDLDEKPCTAILQRPRYTDFEMRICGKVDHTLYRRLQIESVFVASYSLLHDSAYEWHCERGKRVSLVTGHKTSNRGGSPSRAKQLVTPV
jgi:hypothetical protein